MKNGHLSKRNDSSAVLLKTMGNGRTLCNR